MIIKQKIDDLIEIGYNRGEVLEMTKVFPSIFGYTTDEIRLPQITSSNVHCRNSLVPSLLVRFSIIAFKSYLKIIKYLTE